MPKKLRGARTTPKPKPTRRPRRLFLKFRVKPRVAMPKSVMLDKLRHFVKTGVMPKDLIVAYMSYDHKVGREFRPGERIQADEHEELQRFYDVLLAIDQQEMTVEPKAGKYKNPGEVRLERPE